MNNNTEDLKTLAEEELGFDTQFEGWLYTESVSRPFSEGTR